MMCVNIHYILHCIVWIASHSVMIKGSVRERSYIRENGNFETYLSSFKSNTTHAKCAVLCTQDGDCVSYLYNPVIKACSLFSIILNPGSNLVTDWFYMMREPRICPPGWQEFNYMCYYFHNTGGSWNWAKDQCHQREAKFVQITFAEEDNFIRNHIYSIGYTDMQNRDFWIGGTDIVKEGDWRWIETNEPFTYTKWGPNNPDNKNGNQHCSILYEPTGYLWHDTECSNTNSFICEF